MEIYKMADLVDNQISEGEVLVWGKNTWGRFGQHANTYTFVIQLDNLSQKAIFEVIKVRHENRDSSKNAHRYTYAFAKDILSLDNCIIKVVHDYASSRRRVVDVEYYLVNNGKVQLLEVTRGLRDSKGFYDEVKLPDKKRLIVRKDKLEIEP
jgi:hypothetical protein